MSRHRITLKTRVRYEGRVHTIDRRAHGDTDLDKRAMPVYFTIGHILRARFKSAAPASTAVDRPADAR